MAYFVLHWGRNVSEGFDKKTSLWMDSGGYARVEELAKAPARRPAGIPLRAAIVLGCEVSLKASAALSRRCLQHVFHTVGIRRGDLASEIDAAIASPGFPSMFADMLHALRHVGNVAAHPTAGTNLDVEPGEAELLLDVLEDVFDHYFVWQEKNKLQLAAIRARLKPPAAPAVPPAAPAVPPAAPAVPPAGTP